MGKTFTGGKLMGEKEIGDLVSGASKSANGIVKDLLENKKVTTEVDVNIKSSGGDKARKDIEKTYESVQKLYKAGKDLTVDQAKDYIKKKALPNGTPSRLTIERMGRFTDTDALFEDLKGQVSDYLSNARTGKKADPALRSEIMETFNSYRILKGQDFSFDSLEKQIPGIKKVINEVHQKVQSSVVSINNLYSAMNTILKAEGPKGLETYVNSLLKNITDTGGDVEKWGLDKFADEVIQNNIKYGLWGKLEKKNLSLNYLKKRNSTKSSGKTKRLSDEEAQYVNDLVNQGLPIYQTERLSDKRSSVTYKTKPHQTMRVGYKLGEDGKATPSTVSYNTDFKGLSEDLQKVDVQILKIKADFKSMTSSERQAAEKAKAPILQALEQRKAELEEELKFYSGSPEYAADAAIVQKQVKDNHANVKAELKAKQAIADFEKVSSIIDKARTKLQSFGNEQRSGAWTQQLTETVRTMQLLEQNQNKPDLVEKYNAQLQNQLKLLGQIQDETKIQNNKGYLLDQGQIKNAADMTAQMDKYAKAAQLGSLVTEKWNADQTKVTRTYKTTSGQITQLTGQVEKLSNAWRMSSTVSQGQNAFLTGFSKSIGGMIHQLPQLIMGYSAVMKLRSELTAGMSTFKEYDSTLTNISYTMNMTSKELDALGKSAIDMAKDLSMSVSNAEDVYKIYANMNTSAEEIQQLAKPTVILSNLSGVDASTAADEVQGIIQQFDMLKDSEADAADVSMHVVDVLNDISANVAMDYSFN